MNQGVALLARTRHLLFLDESGTHDMQHVDPAFPVFVLLGLLVGETYYAKTLVPRIKRLKQRHFGTVEIVLHSYHIRKLRGAFDCLRDHNLRASFYADLNAFYARTRIRIYAVAIDKRRLLDRFLMPMNPYDVSLSQLLSVVCGPPRIVGANRPVVSRIIAESRGRNEDRALQSEYQGFQQSGLGSYGASDVQNRHMIRGRFAGSLG